MIPQEQLPNNSANNLPPSNPLTLEDLGYSRAGLLPCLCFLLIALGMLLGEWIYPTPASVRPLWTFALYMIGAAVCWASGWTSGLNAADAALSGYRLVPARLPLACDACGSVKRLLLDSRFCSPCYKESLLESQRRAEAEAERRALYPCPHGNMPPDPDCGCGM